MYTYRELKHDARLLALKGIEVLSIGKSLLGRDILCFKLGSGGKPVIVTGAIHARENVAARVVMQQLLYTFENGIKDEIYFIPVLNPDGAVILQEGPRAAAAEAEKLVKNPLLWKANARGVDLNVNFDARWGKGKSNVFLPASENYVGPNPFSEPETAAIRDFTFKVMPELTVSYHACGRELYWYFHQTFNKERDFSLACFIEDALHHHYERKDSDYESTGGYKDWCIEKLGIPSFTIELAPDMRHPLSDDCVMDDIEWNKPLALKLSEKINGRIIHENGAGGSTESV